jgi:hypothetical protein
MNANPTRLPQILTLALAAGSITIGITGCETAPKSAADKHALSHRSNSALAEFKRADPTLQRMLDKAYGYAIFPNNTTYGGSMANPADWSNATYSPTSGASGVHLAADNVLQFGNNVP